MDPGPDPALERALVTEFEKARLSYREHQAVQSSETVQLVAAQKYIAQLERKVGELEAHLRARTSRGKW